MEDSGNNKNTTNTGNRDDSKYKDSERIEKLKNQLNSRNVVFNPKPRTDLDLTKHNLKTSWSEEEQKEGFVEQLPKKGLSIFAKMAIFALIFFITAVSFAAFKFYGGTGTVFDTDVDITVVGPVSVGGGEELVLDIIIQNNNSSILETADLVIEYPDGTKSFEDTKIDLQRVREGLGDIEPNSVVKKTYSAVLFGEEGSKQDIEVRLEYRLPNSTAIFEKKKIFDVVLQSSPIRAKIKTVKEITAGQEFSFNIEVSSNSTKTLNDVMVKTDFPFGFNLKDANFENSTGDDVWVFKELEAGEVINLLIKGSLEGQDSEERVFKVQVGLADKDDKSDFGITFGTLFKSITIKKPFFGLDIKFDGESSNELIRQGKKIIRASVVYNNNLNDPILDGKIKLKLYGEVLDKESISVSRGFYNSIDNTITWDNSTNPNLSELRPRTSASVEFSFASKPLANNLDIFRNPEIVFDAIVTGRRVTDSDVEEEIESKTIKKIRFHSDVAFSSNSLYGVGAFANSGPMPPSVEKDTTYTIEWLIGNSSNRLTNAKVVANLPQYVKWNEAVSPSSSNVVFDPVNRQIVWNIGNIEEGVGYISDPKKVSFQVTFSPSVSQIGKTPVLITSPLFRAQDTFTKTTIEESIPETTIRTEDLKLQTGFDKVVK